MIGLRKLFIFIILFIACDISVAAPPYFGGSVSVVARSSEPQYAHGYQFMLYYDPQCFKWRRFNIYFDTGISHFWVNNVTLHPRVTIYSFAPVIRSTFKRRGLLKPYVEISFGLAYINGTRFTDRNIGMRFVFQDRVGIGVLIGCAERLSLSVHAAHYSNAHLCGHNSGITLPLLIDLGYRFN